MRAVEFKVGSAVTDAGALTDVELDKPKPTGKDILVEVKAVSINPIDTKVRLGLSPTNATPPVLGYDAAGVVAEVGPDCELFQPGDEVFYAGDNGRTGTNAQFHLVDERIVGRKPKSLDFAEAAALPLTSLTAWEALFDRMRVTEPTADGGDVILVVGGAGGVASIAVQLLLQKTNLKIIATASSDESRALLKQFGVKHIIDHSREMAPQIEALGLGQPGLVFSTNRTDHHLADISNLITPQGRLGIIEGQLKELLLLRIKCVSIHFELMFTRARFNTPDIIRQHEILNEIADMVDDGKIRSTSRQNLGTISAENLRRAHEFVETGRTHGKIVLAGW